MSVTDLDNQENGMDLKTREERVGNDAKNAAKLKADIERTKKGGPSSAEAELEAIRQRIAEAKKLTDGRPEPYGRVSDFERGRDAAIRAIEG